MNKPEIETSDKEMMIASLWEERRGRLPSQSLQPISLFITVPSKNISMDEVFNGLLGAMISSDTEMIERWASNWGQARITVHAQKGLSFQFMDRLSNEAKSFEFLTTRKLVEPEKYFCPLSNSPKAKYHILLNNAPVRIEGAILQAERMVDELVWCIYTQKKDGGISGSEAYGLALAEIRENGFDYRYVAVDEILRLKQEDPEYAIRIYGDFLNKGTVPQIVGAICPLGKDLDPPSSETSELPEWRHSQTEKVDLKSNEVISNQLPFVALGITLAKQPHLGHMLLASIAFATSRSLGNAPICIDGNDTGPRINAAVKYGAKALGIPIEQIIQDITKGKIDIVTVEEWYKNRKNIDDRTIIQDSKIEEELSLTLQAESTLSTFKKFFGTGTDVELILESQNLHETQRFLDLGDGRWSDTGFGFINLGNRLLILERSGNPSSEVIRATYMYSASKLLNRGKAYFIDSDPVLKDVFRIYELVSGQTSTQIPGTAIGFNFEIASGTSGNSMSVEDFLSWYTEKYPDFSVVDDITYLVHTRFQTLPPNELSFFNYKDIKAFLVDVQKCHLERINFKTRLRQCVSQIEEKSKEGAIKPLFKGEKKDRKRGYYVLNLLKGIMTSFENGDVEVYSQPENLKESPEVCQAIDLMVNKKLISKEKARLSVLKAIAEGKVHLESSLVGQLKTSGFETEGELSEAVEMMCNNNMGMAQLTNVLFVAATYIIEISSRLEVLDEDTLNTIKKLYAILENNI